MSEENKAAALLWEERNLARTDRVYYTAIHPISGHRLTVKTKEDAERLSRAAGMKAEYRV